MDPLDALVLFLFLGATYVLVRGWSIPSGVLDSFGAGFLPYRADDAWPHGVQEEEPRAWRWRMRDVPDLDGNEPEIVELDHAVTGLTLDRVAVAGAGRGSSRDR